MITKECVARVTTSMRVRLQPPADDGVKALANQIIVIAIVEVGGRIRLCAELPCTEEWNRNAEFLL